MFKQLPHIYIDSSKQEPVLSVNVSSINATTDTVTSEESEKETKLQLSLGTVELIDGQNTFPVLY